MRELIASMLVVLTAPAAAFADWPSSGLPLATGPADHGPPVGITAPAGDVLVFWSELVPNPYALFAQRLTVQGTIASGWPAGGRGVVTAPAAVGRPEVVPDGAGGAFIAWLDHRNAGPRGGIYAVRVDSQAAVMPSWSPSGAAACTTTAEGSGLVRACPDGSGGMFVAWTDSRNTPPMSTLIYDVFAQHLLADATRDPAWPADGLALTGGPGYKYPYALIADAAGGFWLLSENPNDTSQLRVTHHRSDGTVSETWTTPSYATRGAAVSDGAGGIFVTWEDCRDCLAGSVGIYVMRLGANVVPVFGWPQTGVQVVASTKNLDYPVLTATGDGAVMIAWEVNDGGGHDRYVAQRVEGNGHLTPHWPIGGRTFAKTNNIFSGWPLIAPDGAGGAMFAFRRNTPNLFGSRVTSGGVVPSAFPDTGLSLCSLSGDQFLESLVSDGLNGAYVLWQDRRDYPPNNTDVYAMRFTRDGGVGSTTTVGPPTPPSPPSSSHIALSQPSPNPTFGACTFQLTLSSSMSVRVEVLDLTGRLVATVLDEVAPAGPLDLQWDGHDRDRRQVPPGIYLVRARAGGESTTRRIALLE